MKNQKDVQVCSMLALIQELVENGHQFYISPIVRDGKLMRVDIALDIDMSREGLYHVSPPVVSDTKPSCDVHVFYNDRAEETQSCLTWKWEFGMYIPAQDMDYEPYEEEEIAIEN